MVGLQTLDQKRPHLPVYFSSISEQFDISADQMLAAVRKQRLEGVVAKRKDGVYEPGKRTGSWAKMRINKGQEFVIGDLRDNAFPQPFTFVHREGD